MRTLALAILAFACIALATPVRAALSGGPDDVRGIERTDSGAFEGMLPPGPVTVAPAPLALGAAPESATGRHGPESWSAPPPRPDRELFGMGGLACTRTGEVGPFPLRL